MAPKQAEKNLPMASSSEEEEEESGSSSGEEESEKEESHVTPIALKNPEANSEEAEPSKMKRKGQNTHVTKDRPESSVAKRSLENSKGKVQKNNKESKRIIEHETTEEESGSLSGEEESDTYGEESDKEDQSHVTPIASKNPEANSEVAEPSKKKRKGLNTHVTEDRPESSVTKRSLENAKGKNVQKSNKKLKSQTIEHDEATTKEKVKKTPLFTRIFSHKDELALLRGILRFTSKRGDPYEDVDRFYAKLRKKMSFNASQNQLMTKVQRLKSKFEKKARKSLVKGPIVFSKIVDEEIFDLSKNIWGNDGVLASKANKKKLGGNTTYEVMKQETTNVVSTPSSSSSEILSFLKKENVVSFSLDESSVKASWDMVKDGPKKKMMEEKVKTVNEMERELCSQRIQFVTNIANLILGDIPSSSSK